jgi:hypothetical protein
VQIGGEVRPVDSCSGGLPWGGGVEERRSSSERCGVKRCSGGGFYRWRGEGRRRGQGGGRRARRRPPLKPVGSVGRPFPGEEEAGRLEAVTVECFAHWRVGEEARGGGSTPGIGRPARPGRWGGA